MKLVYNITIGFLGTLFLFGCSTTTKITKEVQPLSAEMVMFNVREQYKKISTLQAEGTLSIESPSFSNSASFEMFAHRPDSLLIHITGPFGIDVASASIKKSTILFYNKLNNEYIETDIEKELPVLFNLPINSKDIIDVFCAKKQLPTFSSQPDSFYYNNNDYTLVFNNKENNRQYNYRIDALSYTIISVQEKQQDGVVLQQEMYEYATNNDGTIIPRSVRIIQENLHSSFALLYDNVQTDVSLPSFSIKIPTNAKLVQLK